MKNSKKKNKMYNICFIKSRIGISILLSLFLLTSCNEDDVKQIEKNDCNPYVASDFTKTISGIWAKPNERDEYLDAIVIPNDAGGGYVKVVLSQSHSELRPALIVDNDFNEGGAIISGSSATTNNELIREAHFSVHPGMKYSLIAYPFFNAPTDDYPVDYTITYEFVSKVDCFEPNDTRVEAKKVLMAETIEAYAIAGHKRYVVGALDDHTYDWYKIELKERGQPIVEILDLPTDMRIVTRWFNQKDEQIGGDFVFTGPDLGTPFERGRTSINTTSQILDAGVYYIEVHADFLENGRKAHNDTKPIPAHFNKAYKMRVTVMK